MDKEKTEKHPKVFINWRGVLLKKTIDTRTKVKKNETAAKYNVTVNTLDNWDRVAPPVVQFLRQFAKDNDCTVDELLVEIDNLKNGTDE